MKNNKIQDERILLERRKIQSEAYEWLVVGLMISIIVQQFFMNAPFAQYAVEFFALIGCGGQYNVKNLALYFVSFVLFFFVFRSVMININKKKQQIIDNKLNEDDFDN